MSPRSKFIYLLLALILAFTSLAGGAFAVSHATDVAVDLQQTDTVFHLDNSSSNPTYSIAGDCDAHLPPC